MGYAEYGIIAHTSKTTGEYQTTCPKCSHTRKKKTQKCLSINLDKQVWNCVHCGWSGALPKEKFMIDKPNYIKPKWLNQTKLSDNVVKWFEGRGIRQETLNYVKVAEGVEYMPQIGKKTNTIQFNYFRNNELINIKYRDGRKNFKLHKDSELIFYNIDAVKNNKEVYIVEGEMDCLSLIEVGIKNVVSVPNGATLGKCNLQYVDNCIEAFEDVETIILALDNDSAGRNLREQLSERFGIERCKYIDWEDKKDANEVLQKLGLDGVYKYISQVKDFPLEGVFTIEDYDADIDDMYHNGLESGLGIGMREFDEHLKFVKGYITTITGIPGHGKSDLLDQIILKLITLHKWKCAFYSPENKPTKLHFSKLARKVSGKGWSGDKRINEYELKQIKNYLNNKVFFIKPEKDFTLESILKSVLLLKRKYGIDCFVIDAWNKLEHKYGQSETKYIGESLDALGVFCETNNVHCFLVAHPRKISKDKNGVYEIPNLYDIAGSANFFNKTDNGLSVYRDFEQKRTFIYVQKVKFAHWGAVGSFNYGYDLLSGRYFEGGCVDVGSWIEEAKQTKIEPNYDFDASDINNTTTLDEAPF
jgi:twinkle protein